MTRASGRNLGESCFPLSWPLENPLVPALLLVFLMMAVGGWYAGEISGSSQKSNTTTDHQKLYQFWNGTAMSCCFVIQSKPYPATHTHSILCMMIIIDMNAYQRVWVLSNKRSLSIITLLLCLLVDFCGRGCYWHVQGVEFMWWYALAGLVYRSIFEAVVSGLD